MLDDGLICERASIGAGGFFPLPLSVLFAARILEAERKDKNRIILRAAHGRAASRS